MRILFLGDVVGISGCSKLMNNLRNEIQSKKIDFVIVNGENAASQGVGLTKEICNDFFQLWSRCNYNRKPCLGSKRNNGVY
jgi:calcineurin-like phosphoesterase